MSIMQMNLLLLFQELLPVRIFREFSNSHPGIEDQDIQIQFSATDADTATTIFKFTITTPPTHGTLYQQDGVTVITAGANVTDPAFRVIYRYSHPRKKFLIAPQELTNTDLEQIMTDFILP
jgi:hypothetical protein